MSRESRIKSNGEKANVMNDRVSIYKPFHTIHSSCPELIYHPHMHATESSPGQSIQGIFNAKCCIKRTTRSEFDQNAPTPYNICQISFKMIVSAFVTQQYSNWCDAVQSKSKTLCNLSMRSNIPIKRTVPCYSFDTSEAALEPHDDLPENPKVAPHLVRFSVGD
jgi:hypothetical protein